MTSQNVPTFDEIRGYFLKGAENPQQTFDAIKAADKFTHDFLDNFEDFAPEEPAGKEIFSDCVKAFLVDFACTI